VEDREETLKGAPRINPRACRPLLETRQRPRPRRDAGADKHVVVDEGVVV